MKNIILLISLIALASGISVAQTATDTDRPSGGATPTDTATPMPTFRNGKIAFISGRNGFSWQVYSMDANGGNATNLTQNSTNNSSPTWSPDGTKIAYMSADSSNGYWQVYVMDANGANQVNLTNNTTYMDFGPAWSPDGTKIAFSSIRDGNAEIYVMNPDGTNQSRLTNNSAEEGGPAWSPDGTKIAFQSDRDGNPDIYVMDANGSNQTRLTNSASASDYSPDWSPDGTKILFNSNPTGDYDIYMMDSNGANQTRLTNDPAYDLNPSWSPDGAKIAFASDRDGNYEIYTMDSNGANQTNLTNNPAFDEEPSWQTPTYSNATVQLSTNAIVTPHLPFATTTRLTVATSTDFKGKLEGDPATGVIRITNAHPAGLYAVTVTAFDGAGASNTATFTLTVTTPATCNPVNFRTATNFAVGNQPRSVAVGDFNGDSIQDLVTANVNSNTVSVRLGDGAGGFGAVASLPVGNSPESVVVGDFNGDGRHDIAVANLSSMTVSIILGDGTGQFFAANDFSTVYAPVSLAVGDFNNDGKTDLVTVSENSSTMSILLGSGTGSFGAATTFSVGDAPRSVAVGDFNNDGNQDIATASSGSNTATVLLGDGTGSFGTVANFGVGSQPVSITVGDFNGDGVQDLATANLSSNNVSILLGTGTWSRFMANFPGTASRVFGGGGGTSPFVPAANFAAGNVPSSLAVGDFDGDGIQDLTVTNSGSSVSVLLGNGFGGFDTSTSFGVGSSPFSVAVGDFNADGKQDLATANFGSNNVSVLLRQCVCISIPDMISWWPAENNALDLVSHNNGTLQNAAGFSPGIVGQAFSFHGESTYDGILIGNPPSLNVTSITTEAWINTNTPIAGGSGVISKWAEYSPGDSYLLGIWNNGVFGAIGFGANDVDGGFGGGTIVPHTWTHIAMTYDAVSGVNKLYLNGSEVASRNRTGGIFNTSTNVYIGRQASYDIRPFDGAIDEPTIYGRALSAAEIQSVYNAGSAGKCGSTPSPTATYTPTPAPPTISSVPVIRTAGAGASNSTIANVSDPVYAPNTLTVTVNGGSSATQNGVTVNNINISIGGAVTADVVAATGASDASFTLTATNSATLSATSTLAAIVLSSCPGSGTWMQQAKNTASDGGANDQFGYTVAISGDTAIVGAYLNDSAGGTNAGSAYIFSRSGGVWGLQQKLTPSDSAANDKFGFSVAISGDTVIIGEPYAATAGGQFAGTAYIFTRSGTLWTQQQKLTASDSTQDTEFGFSVAIGADTAIVGTPSGNTTGNPPGGAAYIFTRNAGVWAQQEKLTPSVSTDDDRFGFSVAISGDTVIVGAVYDDTAAGTDAGSAYIFARSGNVWTQQQKLTAPDGTEADLFGFSVAISGDTAIVGEPAADPSGVLRAGAAYIFSRSGSVWTQQQKLTASDSAQQNYFGISVAIGGNTAIVGAFADIAIGSAYIFTQSGSVWTQQKLTASDGAVSDNFGYSVAISGDTAIAGAYFDDTAGGTDAGSSYIYTMNCGATPTASPSATTTYTPTNTPTPMPTCVSNMISWWPGESNALDVVGDHNGTLQNGAGFAAGEVGHAFTFDGVDDAIFVGNPASLNVTSAITIEAWVNTNSLSPGTIKNVVAKWGFDATVDSYLLGLINTGGVIKVFGAIGDGTTGDPGIAGGTVSTNTWTHIAMTYDAANGTNRLYLNGAQVASRTRNGGIYPTVTNVYIGREDSGQGRFFNGLIDEPSIFGRALSAAEIQAIYNAGNLGKCNGSATGTPTNTSTATSTPTPVFALGNYANASVQLAANATIIPDAAPTNTSRMTVAASTNFKGKFEGDPTTGIVRATDAHPAGVYNVTVKAFTSGGATATKTFTLTVTTPPTCNPVAFASAANYDVGTYPRSVAVGDFNRDGRQDLVSANEGSNSVSVLLGNGAGSFGAATNFPVGSQPEAVVVGDFNGDGKQDLAVTATFLGNISIMLGDGTGQFTATSGIVVGQQPYSIAVGDFNGDGKQDLATADHNSDNVSVSFGDGAGGFSTAVGFAVGHGPRTIVVGDLNGDGKQDIVTGNRYDGNVSILLGDGVGGFAAFQSFGTGVNAHSVAIGDFNGDGKQDLATANRDAGTVSILTGDGLGGFSSQTDLNGVSLPNSVAVGDFNGDGKQDLMVGNYASAGVWLFLGNGLGGFGPPTTFGAGSNLFSVAVGDFNGDGMQDIVTDSYFGSVSVLLRQCVYANTSVQLGANTTVTPSATPANAARLTVATSTSFKGKLEGSPTTGVIRITDAHPAGVFPVTVTAFTGAGASTTSTFTLTVTTPASCNQATFAAAATVPVGGNPTSVAIGDFNGDGKQDYAVANFGGYVSVLLGNGTGGFSAPTNFNVGALPFWVAVGDFNGDGNQDLVTANYNSSNVSVLLGNGAGGFGTQSVFPIGTAPESVAVGDFNGDGKQDLVTANSGATYVSVLLGDGAGSFSAPSNFAAPNSPPSVVVGDFNGDGKQDLATNEASNFALILLGNGTGNFGGPAYIGGGTSFAIAIGDFNGDGTQDLASTSSSQVGILIGNGSGGFTSSGLIPAGSFPKSVAVGDFDNDGDQDIVTVNKNSNNVALLVGDGAGSFSVSADSPFNVGQSPNSVAVGDFNGDGRLDIVAANSTSGNLSVLMRQCSAPTSTPTNTPTSTQTNTPTNTSTPVATSTATATATTTATATPTPTVPPSIIGTVTYGNSETLGQATRYVPGVLISAVGSPNVSDTTGSSGTYALTGFGAGPYTITPSKSGQVNGAVTAFDAARIAQYVTGAITITTAQQTAGDVSENGDLSSYDAALIARYAASLGPPNGSTGTWRFDPASKQYSSITYQITGENYSAMLMGDVSGNWSDPSLFRPGIGGSERSTAVSLPRLVAPVGNEIVIPVVVQGAANKGIISYEFDLRYDPSVIQPIAEPVDITGTISSRLTAVANPDEPGLLRVVMYGATPIDGPIDGNGVLLNLKFTAVGASGTVSPLTLERVMFNEGEPGAVTTDGRVELSASTSNEQTGRTSTSDVDLPQDLSTRILSCIPDMISWWPGEENASDVVGSNNGTLQHGATFAQGEVGRSFSFDGVNDDVLIGNPASLNPSSMTIEAWVNTNSFSNGTIENVVAKWGGGGSVDSYLLGLINNGGIVQVFGAIGDGVSGDSGFMGGSVSTNTWTHIAMIYNSANGTNRLYVNGVGVASRTRTGGIYQTATTVYIGREDTVNGRFFNGLIDEPSIYSRVLSSGEIQAIYNAGSAGKCSAFPSPTATEAFTPTPTATYTFTPTPTCTPLMQVSLPVVSATPSVVLIPIMVNDTTGQQIISYDLQITFDPSVVQPASPPFDLAGTLSSGFNVSQHPNYYPGHLAISGFVGSPPLTGSGTLLNLRFNVVGSSGQSTPLVFENYTDPDNIFHGGFIFNEGIPSVQTTNGSVTVAAFTPTPTTNTATNTATPTDTPTNTPTVTPTYTPTPPCISNMISWWPGEFNELDVISHNDGTLLNGAIYNSGEVGYAFGFDGSDDAVFVGNPPSLSITSAITVEAWINTNSIPVGSISNVLAKWGFDATVDSYLLGLFNNGGTIQAFGAVGDGVTGDPGITGGTVSTNTWTHIAMTYDSVSGSNRLYLNGIEVASRVRNGGIYSTVTNVYIGREDSPEGRFFSGSIDEPSIYDRALSAAEIQAIYNNGSAGKCGASSTPTNTATPSETPSIKGTITYGNAAAQPKFISNVMVTGAGSTNVSAFTEAQGATAGQYALTGFGDGSYIVTPTKTGQVNGITSNDAARVAQHVSGTLLFNNNNQKVTADVSGNGLVTSNDAALIARFVTGLGTPVGNTGQWKFYLPSGPSFPPGSSPTTRSYESVTGSLTGDDYIGLLIGDATGNWNPSGSRPVRGPLISTAVDLPHLVIPVDNEVIIPIAIQGAANKAIISYEFDLRYDPTVIQPLLNSVDVTGTLSCGLTAVANPNKPGLLRVAVYGPMPIDGNGVLLNLKFTAVGPPGSESPLTWKRIMFNEGEPRVSTTDGEIRLF